VSTEQEYDAQADMVDEDPTESGPGPYPEPLPPNQHHMAQQQAMNRNQQPGQQGQGQGVQMEDNAQGFGSMTQLLDPYDPMLDMDPFGLSASM